MSKIFSSVFALLVVLITFKLCEGKANRPQFDKPILIEVSECTLHDLESKTDSGAISCFSDDGNVVQHGGICMVETKDVVLDAYICDSGIWNIAKGTDTKKYHRQKRFFGALFAWAVSTLLKVITSIVCHYTDSNICGKEAPVNQPPTYSGCPPADLKPLYTATEGETDVVVSWTKPNGQDDKGIQSNKLTSGGMNGGKFRGIPGSGYAHSITYTVTDNDGLKETCQFSFQVKYLLCATPSIPPHGQLSSCTDWYLYGSICTFSCNEGYEFPDDKSSTITCQESEKWTSQNSTLCSKVACRAPFSVTNGSVVCEDESHLYDSDCNFICDSGFELSGTQRKMTCQADKTWSVSSNDVNCEDDEAPIISCDSPQVFYADRGIFSTTVNWTTPTAVDNVDLSPTISQTFGPIIGGVLDEGLHYAQYQVSDALGKTSPECTITIEVKLIYCYTGPTDALNVSRFMLYNCSDSVFYNGVSCDIGCDLNLPLIGNDTMTCERLGATDKGIWSWGDGEEPYCEVVECPTLNPPTNGAIGYDTVNARPVNTMLCQSGYDISNVGAFTGSMICQDSGNWEPLSEFPDCIISKLPFQFLSAELYYEGECDNEATKESIRQQFLKQLATLEADINNSICPSTDTCSTNNVHVKCGETTGKKRRSADHFVGKRASMYIIIAWDFEVIFVEGNKSILDAYVYYEGILANIITHTDSYITNGGLSIDGLTHSDGAFQTADFSDFKCHDPGYLQTGVECKPCPSGTYLDSFGSTKECKYCNIGEYMDHAGSVACDLCDDGYSTLTTGTKLKSSCIKKCSAGFYSPTTMEPCSACPVGTYQSIEGQISCTSCPSGQLTQTTNSTASASCVTYDLLFKNVFEEVQLSTFIANSTGVVTFAFWSRIQTSLYPSIAMKISSTSTSFLTLWINKTISVDIGTVNESSNTLSADRWTFLVLSLDILAGEYKLLVDGSLTSHSTDVVFDSNDISGEITIQSHSSNGILMSGFSVYGRVLGTSEISSLLQSCSAVIGNEHITLQDVHDKLSTDIVLMTPSKCDAINDCKDVPCGTHTCIDDVDGFTCICHNDMTGTLCDVEPDYCIGNECDHGTCVPGNRTYTCSCTDGYTGVMCGIPPVNGNWSYWSQWGGCDVTCGGGTRNRNRECNNPAPGYMGNDCEGSSIETEACNTDSCPECPTLERKIRTVVSCSDIDNNQVCNMTCVSGSLLPNGQRPYEEYRCGQTTGYEWIPIDKVPACVPASRSPLIGINSNIVYEQTIPSSSESGITQQITNNLDSVSCRNSGLCSLSVTSSSSKRRSVGTTVTLQFNIELTVTGEFGLAEYIDTNTTTPAMAEYIEALNASVELISYIQNNTSVIFNIDVDGIQYTVDTESLNVAIQMYCEEGYAGTNGVCVQCPAGTKYVDELCISCDVDTYQPDQGQSTCITCPTGYTTEQYGATDITECTILTDVTASTTPTTQRPEEVTTHIRMTTFVPERPNNKEKPFSDGIIVVIALSVVVVILSSLSVACFIKKKARRKYRNGVCSRSASAVSMNMVHPSVMQSANHVDKSDMDNAWVNGCTDTSLVKNNPPSYDSHDF